MRIININISDHDWLKQYKCIVWLYLRKIPLEKKIRDRVLGGLVYDEL